MANIKKILGHVENAWPGQGDSCKAVLQIKKKEKKKKKERKRKSEKEIEGKNKEKD